MARFYVPRTGSVLESLYKQRKAIEWLAQSYDDEYHVFVEFQIPGGREADLLIIHRYGAWCIEEKDIEFTEIYANKPWKYRNKVGNLVEYSKPIGKSIENPYQQAIATADSFKMWLFRNKDSIFDVDPNLNTLEKFKAFKVDPELNTIVWGNGADLAPEFLHRRLLIPTQPRDQPDHQ